MRIRILGSAAGGRFPQWNCGCGNCVAVRENARENARENKFAGKARTQAQLALSADGSTWFLAGASPDLAFQIESFPDLHPRALQNTPRDSPIAGVVLGSADLDHVLGLLLLRELQPLRVYAAPSILRILREENSMFGMLNRGGSKRVKLSRFNMFGLGTWMMKLVMKDSHYPSIDEFIEMAREMGVKLIPCSTTCGMFGLAEESFRSGVESISGAAFFLNEARKSKVTLFI